MGLKTIFIGGTKSEVPMKKLIEISQQLCFKVE